MLASLRTARLTLRRVQQGGILARLGSHISLAFSAWRQRRHLERLDDAGLADIGLTRHQADAEARRPVWDVPSHWLR